MTQDEIFTIVTRHAVEVIPDLKDHPFDPSESLRSLGANSIDRSEIVMMTLETLSLQIPLLETTKANNIGELVSLLHSRL